MLEKSYENKCLDNLCLDCLHRAVIRKSIISSPLDLYKHHKTVLEHEGEAQQRFPDKWIKTVALIFVPAEDINHIEVNVRPIRKNQTTSCHQEPWKFTNDYNLCHASARDVGTTCRNNSGVCTNDNHWWLEDRNTKSELCRSRPWSLPAPLLKKTCLTKLKLNALQLVSLQIQTESSLGGLKFVQNSHWSKEKEFFLKRPKERMRKTHVKYVGAQLKITMTASNIIH